MNVKSPVCAKRAMGCSFKTPSLFKPIKDKAGKGSLGPKHLLLHPVNNSSQKCNLKHCGLWSVLLALPGYSRASSSYSWKPASQFPLRISVVVVYQHLLVFPETLSLTLHIFLPS